MSNQSRVDYFIPEMTHEMGKYWSQPNRFRITEEPNGYVSMSSEVLAELATYSHSLPSGVYPGKMWKCMRHSGVWLLRWYAEDSSHEDSCFVFTRKILISDMLDLLTSTPTA